MQAGTIVVAVTAAVLVAATEVILIQAAAAVVVVPVVATAAHKVAAVVVGPVSTVQHPLQTLVLLLRVSEAVAVAVAEVAQIMSALRVVPAVFTEVVLVVGPIITIIMAPLAAQ